MKERAESKLKNIEEKLRDLQRMRDVIAQLVTVYDGSNSLTACPFSTEKIGLEGYLAANRTT
jgi:hypothetical protein